MSPCDFDSVPVLRLAIPQRSNHDVGGTKFEIPALSRRKLLVATNPVAAAIIFDRIQDALFQHLVGLGRATSSRKSPDASHQHRGCLGTPRHFFSVTESQGRGSLHLHALLWVGLPTSVLQRYVHRANDMLEKIIQYLDAIVTSYLPEWDTTATDDETPHANHPSLSAVPDFRRDPSAFYDRAFRIARTHNVHKHSGTCTKPPKGKIGCRMNYPQAQVPKTRVVQLIRRDDAFGPVKPKEPIFKRDDISFISCPVELPDDRALVLETKRPTVNDKNVVTYSPVLTGTLACNTAVYPLCNVAQGKGCIRYIVKYMTKVEQYNVNHRNNCSLSLELAIIAALPRMFARG